MPGVKIRSPSETLDDAHLINTALDIHAADPEFGYRLIADELNFNKGFSVSENRVWRLCRAQGIVSVIIKPRVSGRSAGPAVHDDLVVRDFSADRPNKKWITDISEHPTDEGKLYLCAAWDCFSRQLVGYSMDSGMQASLATAALGNAIMLRNPIGTIVHSDRGSQFRSKKYVMMLANNGLQGSMGRVGAAGDNAAMESFFALLQKNVLNRKRRATREELRPGNRDLDRGDLQPQAPSTGLGMPDSDRVRNNPSGKSGSLKTINPRVNQSGGSPECSHRTISIKRKSQQWQSDLSEKH